MAKPDPQRPRQELIGSRTFVDGISREVFLDVDGRQFVWDDNEKVFGVWILSNEEEADQPITILTSASN